MKIIGITGPMASGKSTCCSLLSHSMLNVFNADKEVHKLYAHDQTTIQWMKLHISPDIIVNNAVCRHKLRQLLQHNQNLLHKIEHFVHPKIELKIQQFVYFCKRQKFPWVIIETPLLYETKLEQLCHITITTYVSEIVRQQRIKRRLKQRYTQMAFLQQKQLQHKYIPGQSKNKLSSFLVHTGNGKRHALKQLLFILYY